jgi:dynamin 1-like protein
LIAIERAYINTNHADFLGAAGAMAQLESQTKKHRALERKRAAKVAQMNGRIEHVDAIQMPQQQQHQTSTLGGSPKNDSFLNYFFGGANKNDRPALGAMDGPHNSASVSPPSISKVVEAEMERQLGEKLSIKDQQQPPSQSLDRDELEVRLIRESFLFLSLHAVTHLSQGTKPFGFQ